MDQQGDFGTVARLIVTALISAAVSATLVIAIGQTLLDRAPTPSGPSSATLIPTSG